MRLLEGNVNAQLLSLHPWENLGGRLRWDSVLWHLGRQGLLLSSGDRHWLRGWVLDELWQVLTVVPVEADALEPRVENRGLVLPRCGQVILLNDDISKHDVAHIVPDASVHKLNPPLVGQVSADLVSDLLAALVHQIWQIFPCNFAGVHVEHAAGSWHVPSRCVPSSHVEDHVHVFQGERACWVQQLMVGIYSGKEGMVLKEIDLGSLLEVLRLAHCQELHAQIIIDTVTWASRRWSGVEVLVVSMGNNNAICRHLVDLRGCDWVMRMCLQGAVHLASKVTLHWVSIVVHQHRILGLDKRLSLEETCDWCIGLPNCKLSEVLEKTPSNLASGHMSAPTHSWISIIDVHAPREHAGQV
mmetsp:Transcript_25670/g.59825  ORF Transcript_25670/g.59825 Transcript_25670/m.59825 type:complete len:357 (+) Transcript_25670:601-1671(+)